MEKIKENTTFKEGDVVVYGSQGICRITGTEKMRVGGKSTIYFILHPVYRKNSKIFVPSDNEKLMEKMHSVIEKDEIDELSGMPQRTHRSGSKTTPRERIFLRVL